MQLAWHDACDACSSRPWLPGGEGRATVFYQMPARETTLQKRPACVVPPTASPKEAVLSVTGGSTLLSRWATRETPAGSTSVRGWGRPDPDDEPGHEEVVSFLKKTKFKKKICRVVRHQESSRARGVRETRGVCARGSPPVCR